MFKLLSLPLALILTLSSCNKQACKSIDVGKQVVNQDGAGGSASFKAMEGNFNEIGTLVSIENLENVDLRVSIVSKSDRSKSLSDVVIARNTINSEFAGIPSPFEISIERNPGVHDGNRGDGADLNICYFPK